MWALGALLALLAVLALSGPGARASCTAGSAGGLTSTGDAISSAGPAVGVIGLGATSGSSAEGSLVELRLDFGGSGFSPGDLAPLSTSLDSSGVALYRDDGTDEDALDCSDSPVMLSGCAWKDRTAVLRLDQGSEDVPRAVSGLYHWLVAIRADASMTDGDQVSVSLGAGGALFSDATTMPDAGVRAESLTADSTAPEGWGGFTPSGWTTDSRTPDVSVSVQDSGAGLAAGTAACSYSTDGGASWSVWASAGLSGADGSNSRENLSVQAVQFCQDSADRNLVRFRVADRAGNTGESGAFQVPVDTTGPGGWTDLAPSGWFRFSQSPSVTVVVRDAISGLENGSARYQYSTDAGMSWSGWAAAGLSGNDGEATPQTLTAESVPFGQDSADRNLVRFKVEDLAGNLATSDPFEVRIDTTGPARWRGLDPAGWTTATRSPGVLVQVDDPTSGLDPAAASFQYSSDAGATWSAWRTALLAGDGWLWAEAVPFDRDSSSHNQVRFKAGDRAGNSAESQPFVIRIDTAGPDGWEGLEPSGWHSDAAGATVAVTARDGTSGLAPGTARFRFSSDGGTTWSGWSEAVLGEEGASPGSRRVIAEGVRFARDSSTENLVEFQAWDVAGNSGRSGPLAVRTDCRAPGNWTGFSPSRWTVESQNPTATVWVHDPVSGLRAGSAGYQYSTDAGLTWSGWLTASHAWPDGATDFRLVLAVAIPFGQDSGAANLVRFRVTDVAGNEGTSPDYAVPIDTEAPSGWSQFSPAGWYGRSQCPTVTVSVRDRVSGLDASSAEYRYSTDGGLSWSAWLAAGTSAGPDAASGYTLTAAGVPFARDSAALNLVRFRVSDRAGNLGPSQTFTVRIDTTPPGGWEGFEPSGWCGRTGPVTATVRCRDAVSGILPGRAEFQCSSDGGLTWGAWMPAGMDGTGGGCTLAAANLGFGGLPSGAVRIRFRLADLAGNAGTSGEYTLLVDTEPPGGWAGPSPGGWFTLTRQPTITVEVDDRLSGLDVHGAEYRYSTDGGATWSGWRPAALSGWSGATAPQTITATRLPFDQDSGTLNLVQFRARDLAGNVGESPVCAVRVDCLPPSSSAHQLRSHIASRTVVLEYDAADAVSGAASVELWYGADGGDIALFGSVAAGAPFNFTAPSDGLFRFFLRARDVAGNLEPLPASPDAWAVVDTRAPGVSLEVREGGGRAIVTGRTEPGARVTVNGRAAPVDGSGSFELELPLPPGRNTFTATAVDTAGNAASASASLAAAGRGPSPALVAGALALVALGALAGMALLLSRKRRA